MGGLGPPPKDPSRRARKNKPRIPTTVLRAEGPVQPPALPDQLASRPEVLAWWTTWLASPQAETFMSTDWMFLLETAYLVHAFYEGNMKVAAEIRLRQAKLGATAEDRARLRMTFGGPRPESSGAPAPGRIVPDARQRYGQLRVLSSRPDPEV